MKPSTFAIKTNSVEEASIAAHFLSSYYDRPIGPATHEIIRGVSTEFPYKKYPFVAVDQKRICAVHVESDQMRGRMVIEFKDLFKVVEITKTMRLNQSYDAVISDNGVTVGCQTFCFEVVKQLAQMCEEWQKETH